MIISFNSFLPFLFLVAVRNSCATNPGNNPGKENAQGTSGQESKVDNAKPDPFGIMTMASRIGRAANPNFDDYSMENDSIRHKDDMKENGDSFKGRKESDRQNHDEMNKSMTVEKSIKRKEQVHTDVRTKDTNSGRDVSRGERRTQDRSDPRNSGRRNETSRRKSYEEDRKRFDEDRTSYSQDRRQYHDEERQTSYDNRRERGGSSPGRGGSRRRGDRNDRPDRNPKEDRHRGRFIHRIVVTNKVICPNCTGTPMPAHPSSTHSNQAVNGNPYYYY